MSPSLAIFLTVIHAMLNLTDVKVTMLIGAFLIVVNPIELSQIFVNISESSAV